MMLGLLALATASPGAAQEAPRYDADLKIRLFEQVWSLTGRRYWDQDMRGVDWEAARARHRPAVMAAHTEQGVYAALNTMLAELRDSHVYATSPSALRRTKARPRGGAALGLGFVAVQENSEWRISSIAPESPAARAGIGVGWRLDLVDGRPIDTDYQPADGQPLTLSMRDARGVRRQMRLLPSDYPSRPPWRAERLGNNMLLLALDDLDRGADRWVAEQIAAGPWPRAVLIDLRENRGGESRVLDRFAGAFFLEKQLILRLASRRGERKEWTRGAGPRAFEGPLVVLVGPRTASAAEAFAALIQESGRGLVVGDRTAGRLTGAAHHRLSDGGELSLAEEDVRTPAGRRIEGAGLLPDRLIQATLLERAREDAALRWAVRLASGTKLP